MNRSLKSLLNSPLVNIADAVLTNEKLRGAALNAGQKYLYHALVDKNPDDRLMQVQKDKYYVLRNLLYSIDKALENDRISHACWKGVLRNLIGNIIFEDNSIRRDFKEKHGFVPPSFLLISPTKRCNLHCIGCYASSSSANAEKLNFHTFDRILTEKRKLWGSFFTVISGGEPLMWKDDGYDFMDIASKHNDEFFLMYTNATLINDKMARRMAELGNITPAISVEGLEKETDARRGKGVHQKILRAMGHLRNYGVPFGISITAMKSNAELALSDEFMDFYFDEQGASYGWIFQYMPIGRSYTLDLMVTPEQRKRMFEQEQHLVREKKLFIVDFWNSGAVSDGCISAGRSGGYYYIDWNGNCMPCAFYPYTVDNIYQVYENGGDLNTVLMSPFFKSIRKWQQDYSYEKQAPDIGNQIVPCALKDHHEQAREIIAETGAKPADKAAGEALRDVNYYSGLAKYGEKVDELTQPIWQEHYVRPELQRRKKNKAA